MALSEAKLLRLKLSCKQMNLRRFEKVKEQVLMTLILMAFPNLEQIRKANKIKMIWYYTILLYTFP